MPLSDSMETFLRKSDDSLRHCLIDFFSRRKSEGEAGCTPSLNVLVGFLLRQQGAEAALSRRALQEIVTSIEYIECGVGNSKPGYSLAELFTHAVTVAGRLGTPRVSIPVLLRSIACFPGVGNPVDRRIQEILNEMGLSGIAVGQDGGDQDLTYQGLGYGIDLSRKVQVLVAPPLIGREKELREVMELLLAGLNPVFIGEAGVGKSAVAEGLAWALCHPTGIIPPRLQSLRIISIGAADLVASTKHRGDLEERLKHFLEHVISMGNVVPFVDEIHHLFAAGGQDGQLIVDALKPAMAREEFRIMGATTEAEFQRFFSRDRALRQRFRPVLINEPSEEEAVEIIEKRGSFLLPRKVRTEGVSIGRDAAEAAVRLTSSHMPDDRLPRKAVDILVETGSHKVFTFASNSSGREMDLTLTERDVVDALARKLGLLPEILTGEEFAFLDLLEEQLAGHIVGQDEAVEGMVEGLSYAFSGYADPKKPLASLFLWGSPGVGKSEACRIVARTVCGTDRACLEFPMPDYQDEGCRFKFTGSGPGYRNSGESWTVFSAVSSRPNSVVVLDGIEYLPEELREVIRQVLDGHALDGMGNPTDFSKCVFIFTAGRALSDRLRHVEDEGAIRDELERILGPAVARKISHVVPFEPLTRNSLGLILGQEIDQMARNDRGTDRIIESLRRDEVRGRILDETVKNGADGETLKIMLQRTIGELVRIEREKRNRKKGSGDHINS